MIKDQIENLIIICNVEINQESGDTRETFLDKVRGVKAIRCWWRNRYTSIYLTSTREFINLKYLYDVVNQGVFKDMDANNYRFAIGLPSKLFNWILSTSFEVIQRQIINWMAFQYFYQADKREIYNDQFYPPALEEVIRNINKYYFKILNISEETRVKDISGMELFEKWPISKIIEFYQRTCTEIYRDSPPDFLKNPFDWYSESEKWGLQGFDFDFLDAYFTESDWENIITNKGNDSLYRVESRKDMWNKWLHTFSTYEETGRNIYSFYLKDDLSKGESRQNHITESLNLDNCIELLSNHDFQSVFVEINALKEKMTKDQKEILTIVNMRYNRLKRHRILGILKNQYLEENNLAYDILKFIQVLKK